MYSYYHQVSVIFNCPSIHSRCLILQGSHWIMIWSKEYISDICIVMILIACQVHEDGSTFRGELKRIACLIVQTSYNLLSASDLAKNLDAAGYQACIHAWVVELLTDGKFMHGPCNTNVSDVRVTYHKLNILAGHNPEPWASSNYAAVPYILLLQQEISRHPIPRYIQRCCSR